MKSFIITSIENNKAIAKEVNPIYKPNAEYYKPHEDRIFNEKFMAWQEVESNLKEYELTEDSIKMLKRSFLFSSNPQTYGGFMVNKVINGELVNDSGTEKIKVI